MRRWGFAPFCAACPARHAVVASLARTLGREGINVQQFSRVSACRRVLNSHDAASRESRASCAAPRSLESRTAQPSSRKVAEQHLREAADGEESHANDLQLQSQTSASRCVFAFRIQSVLRATAGSGCAHTKRARRWLENADFHARQRAAGSNWSTPASAARSRYVRRRMVHRGLTPRSS